MIYLTFLLSNFRNAHLLRWYLPAFKGVNKMKSTNKLKEEHHCPIYQLKGNYFFEENGEEFIFK